MADSDDCITPTPLLKSTGSDRCTPSPIDNKALFNATDEMMQQSRKVHERSHASDVVDTQNSSPSPTLTIESKLRDSDTQLSGDGSSQAPDVAPKPVNDYNKKTYTIDQMGARQPGGQAFR